MKRIRNFEGFILLVSCLCFTTINSQNLLDTSTWTIGSGTVSGFAQNGSTSENLRGYGENHIGEQVILWKAVNDAGINGDGGWNSNYHNINYNKSHRFSVWLKKTNSNNGTSYFGPRSSQHIYAGTTDTNIKRLDGNTQTNPYFWYGDLPELNKWYLLVGYVHNYQYSSTVHLGGIYDGETGMKVQSITDFKHAYGTVNLRHRAYLFYDPDINDRQYFYDPRLDVINGSEPTINSLLRINPNSRIKFEYDLAGNQKVRYYCPNGNCFISRVAPKNSKEVVAKKESVLDDLSETTLSEPKNSDLLAKSISLYPNPTSSKALIKITGQPDLIFTSYVNIYNINGSLIDSSLLDSDKKEIEIDLSDKATGVYHVHVHLSNGKSVTKKIVKN